MAMNFEDYFVSETYGFVIEDPLVTLPDYFEPWNHFAKDMSPLVAAGTMRQQIQEMPLLDWRKLEGHRQKRLAHFQLTIMASGYVWQEGDNGVSKVLPACVAVPLYGLSEELGLPPVICHSGMILANYAPIDPLKPLELDNLRAVYCAPGGRESEWFCIITTMIELTFAKGIKSILAVLKGMECNDETLVTSSLIHITQIVKEMQKVFSRMHENLTADTFFNTLRPFLNGWGGEGNPLPDGLIYEGVSDEPIHAAGGSEAQSSTIQVLDALLGVQHSAEKKSFLLKMRGYMLPAHQCFIHDLENWPESLPDMVKSSGSEELRQAYNTLLSTIVDFRSYHIQIVTKYVVQASAKKRAKEEKKYKSLDKKGTGGTDLLPFLKELRQDTKDCMKDADRCQGRALI